MADGAHIPAYCKGVRLRHDAEKGRWRVERGDEAVHVDDIAASVLGFVNGSRPVDTIVDLLVQRYDAPRARIASDVLAVLDDLATKGMLRFREPPRWKSTFRVSLLWLQLLFRKKGGG